MGLSWDQTPMKDASDTLKANLFFSITKNKK
jgi:hypothetical protein